MLNLSRLSPLFVSAALVFACADDGTSSDSGGDAAPDSGGVDDVVEMHTDAGGAADANDDGQTDDAGGMDAPDAETVDAADADASVDADATVDAGPMRCNGHTALCDRPLDEVAFPATHNSMSADDEGWWPPNQQHGIERQLDDGIRAMLLDTYEQNGEMILCHSVCELGSRPLVDAFEGIGTFLDDHPHEVLVFILQDSATVDGHVAAFEESGLVDHVYAHPEDAPWPTLGEMIDDGTRLVVTTESGRSGPDWFHGFWDIGWDTPYTFETVEDFSCRENRGSTDHALFLMNHWLAAPLSTVPLATEANAFDVLYGRAVECMETWEHIPNFVAVDQYAVGDLFRVVDVLNGVADPP